MSTTDLTALVGSIAAIITAVTGLIEAMRVHRKVKKTASKVSELQAQVNGSPPETDKAG